MRLRPESPLAESPVDSGPSAPSVTLPKGGGAVRGIGEKFAANPATGTGGMTVPIATSPARSELGPQLALTYDSGAGKGPFGMGWQLALPAITRKTDTGLPQYRDAEESDVFLLSGAEDLVPELTEDGTPPAPGAGIAGYTVRRYRPRIEGGFSRIERWSRDADGDTHWRVLSADNVLSVYGRDSGSRIADPADPRRVFSWLLCETRDDRGDAVIYRYKQEDATGVDVTLPHERHRGAADSPARTAGRYIKSIRYGNQIPLLDAAGHRPVDVAPQALHDAGWMFEVVFDYGEHGVGEEGGEGGSEGAGEGGGEQPGTAEARPWLCRSDPFSFHRPGFEVRTYRLCQRVLMFHHFPDEPGVGTDCLVRSTDFAYRAAPDAQGVPGDRRTGHPVTSFIESVTGSGYLRNDDTGYTRTPLPPVTFEYSRAEISTTVQRLAPGSLENLPTGLDDGVQWVDLDGCTLTLTSNHLRKDSTLLAGTYERNLDGDDPRFRDEVGAVQSIATSTAQNDQGLFQLDFRDERYLPFEGAGAISSWHLRLNKDLPQFDFDTISDVVLHVHYTAREGGALLASHAAGELTAKLNDAALAENRRGLFRVVDLKREYPDAWYRFLHPGNPADDQQIVLHDLPDRLPYFTRAFTAKKARKIEVVARMKDTAAYKAMLSPLGSAPADLLDLVPDPVYQGLHRAAKDLTGSETELAPWTLKLRAAGAADYKSLSPDAVEELFLVINYTIG